MDECSTDDRYVPRHLRLWTDPNKAGQGLVRYAGEDLSDRYVLLSHDRDSGALDESNWEAALGIMEGKAGFEIHRFNHWGCGWIETMMVAADAPEDTLRAADNIARGLADYPVLDEEDFCEREMENAAEIWDEDLDLDQRLDYVRRYAPGESDFTIRHDFRKACRLSLGGMTDLIHVLNE